jgi:hypothetical protein
METSELLRQVKDFYDSAWNTLLWGVGIIIALFGVIVPIIIQRMQKQILKHQEAEIRNKLIQQMSKHIDDKFSLLKVEIEKNHDHNKGEIWHLQGLYYETNGNLPRAVASYLNSATFYSKAEHAVGCLRVLDNAFDFLPHCTKEKFHEELDYLIVDLDKTFEIIKSHDPQRAYTDKIAQIKKRIGSLV